MLPLFTILAVLIITFYQLFVDQNYRPLGLKRLLNFQTMKKLISARQVKSESCQEKTDYIFSTQDHTILIRNLAEQKDITILLDLGETLEPPFFLNRARQKTGYLTKKDNQKIVNIYNLNNGHKQQSVLAANISQAGIINFDDFDNLYFYYQDKDLWTIAIFNGSSSEIIVNNINYNGTNLTLAVEPIQNLIIYPECQSFCQFISYSIKDKSKKSNFISTELPTENSAYEVKNVNLLFFDEDLGRIIYEIPQNKVVYITDFNGYLWHHIYLEPVTGNAISINGILTDVRGQKKLIASSKLKKQAYVYDINFIGLKLLDLGNDFEVYDQPLNQPADCLLLEDKNKKEFIFKNVVTEKEEKISELTDYLQIF